MNEQIAPSQRQRFAAMDGKCERCFQHPARELVSSEAMQPLRVCSFCAEEAQTLGLRVRPLR